MHLAQRDISISNVLKDVVANQHIKRLIRTGNLLQINLLDPFRVRCEVTSHVTSQTIALDIALKPEFWRHVEDGATAKAFHNIQPVEKQTKVAPPVPG